PARDAHAAPCNPCAWSPNSLSFFSHPAPTDLYPLSLHDALPISTGGSTSRATWTLGRFRPARARRMSSTCVPGGSARRSTASRADRKSTRLNSSHVAISYAVFCLKKKKMLRLHLHEPAESAAATR